MFNHINRGNFPHTQVRFAERKSFAESGRSMVEMLGVLAIIGILSMVGIKAFNTGMTQHRANELLNEAQKRAVVVAAQIMAGGDNLSVAEFKNPEGYSFGVEKNPANDKQFNITLTGVKLDVCAKMKTMVDSGSVVRVISKACDKLTFNNDLSKTEYASDYNAQPSACTGSGHTYTWCGGNNVCQEAENCCDGKVLTQCQGCSEGAVLTTAKEGAACDYTEGMADGICHNGTCVAKSTEINCVNGGPRCRDPNYGTCCPAGYFCTTGGDTPGTCSKFASGCSSNADCTDPAKPWCRHDGVRTYSCDTPTTGTCSALGNFTQKTVFGLGIVIKNESNASTMNWWNARNWCEAMGKHLINVEDFQAYRSGTTNQIVANSTAWPACAKGKKCGLWDAAPYSSMWNGNTLVETAGDADGLYKDRISRVMIDLRQKFGAGVFWTASTYNNDACYALTARTLTGGISFYYRSHPYGVICH